jgi:hypothetical protein
LAAWFVSHPLPGLPSQSPNPTAHTGTQPPDTQAVVPLAFVHPTRHAPQFEVVASEVSQPLTALPSQLPNPASHAGAHVPAMQEVVPCAFRHSVPQAPQLPGSCCVFASHPFEASPSQLLNPALHDGMQAAETHCVVPLALVHALPHTPQFAVVLSEASHPLATEPSQLPNPALHAIEHSPAAQLGVPLVLLHTVPHAPQWFVLVLVAVSHPFAALPSQLPNPASQETIAQVPVEQLSVAFARLQGMPHAPQLARDLSSASQPFADAPSQLPQPASHAPGWQVPPKHSAAACAKLHALAHAPQWLTLLTRLVSHPLLARPSQLPQPPSHTMEQAPPVHTAEPWAPAHTVPHAPQWLAVVLVSVSQPLAVLPSQLPHPAAQAPNVHVPEPHVAEALGNAQGTPHPPQLVAVVRAVSQPLLGLPSQFP